MGTNGGPTNPIDLTADSDSDHESDDDPELELEKLRASFTTRKHRTSPSGVKDVNTTKGNGQEKPRTIPFVGPEPVKSVESPNLGAAFRKSTGNDTDYLSKAKDDTRTALHKSNMAIAMFHRSTPERSWSAGSAGHSANKPQSSGSGTAHGNNNPSLPLAQKATATSRPPLLMPKTSKVPPVLKSGSVSTPPHQETIRQTVEGNAEPKGIKRSADGDPKLLTSRSSYTSFANGQHSTSKHISDLPRDASLRCPESKCFFVAGARVLLLEHLVINHGWSRTAASGGSQKSSDISTKPQTPTQDISGSQRLLNDKATPAKLAAVSNFNDSSMPKKPITIKLNTKPKLPPTAISPLETDETRDLVAKMKRALDNTTSRANFLPEEDRLLIHLKEDLGMPWSDIYRYMPQRPARNGLNSRYSRCLKPEDRTLRKKTKVLHQEDLSDEAIQAERRRSTRTNVEEASRRGLYVPKLRLSQDYHLEGAALTHVNNVLASLEVSAQRSKLANDNSEDDLVSATKEAMRNSNHSKPFKMPIKKPSSLGHSMRNSVTDVERGHRERHRDSAALASMTTRIFRSPVPESSLPNVSPLVVKPPAMRLQKKRSVDMQRPYLTYRERCYLQESVDDIWNDEEVIKWNGRVLHVDFLKEEIETLEPSILKVLHYLEVRHDLDLQPRMSTLLKHASMHEISRISARVQRKGVFINRSRDSIESFLLDLAHRHVQAVPALQRITVRPPGSTTIGSIDKCRRARELGSSNKSRATTSQLGQYMLETLGPRLSFKGTSGDVTNLAWSPNSNLFVAGSAAVVDAHSMQYNLPNNLLLGDLEEKSLRELPNHLIRREIPDSGVNASRNMFVSQDPYLFTTVSSVAFSLDGTAMYSTGYDRYARVWDVGKGIKHAKRVMSIVHQGYIDTLAVGQDGLFATGAQGSLTESVRVWRCNLDSSSATTRTGVFYSRRAIESPDLQLAPSAMKWNTYHKQLAGHLLCGFSSNSKDFGAGEAWVWNVETLHWHQIHCTRNIFDVAWSPSTFGQFAIGCTAGGNVNKGTKSVVRIHHTQYMNNLAGGTSSYVKPSYTYELECPALDMNDVVFNPSDGYLVSTGCTDGTGYMWDLRNPDQILHRFRHGEALTPLDESRPREETDTGIRFLSWDSSGRRLFTGSSDGIVAAWDAYRSTEDAHVRNVAKLGSAVMSGAFSPDFTNLALGEDQGKISVFSVGQEDKEAGDFETFNLERADAEKADIRKRYQTTEDIPGDDDFGIEAACQKLQQLEIEIKPLGDMPVRQAVQGPRYHGPYDTAPDAPRRRSEAQQFQNRFQPSRDPCQLDHSIPKITEEGMGDNGASKARIPGAYRFMSSPFNRVVPERCFRCGQQTLQLKQGKPSNDKDIMRCSQCKLKWQADVLGYTLVDDEKFWPDKGPLRAKRWHIESSNDGDSVLEDYYHHLWQDRPASPL